MYLWFYTNAGFETFRFDTFARFETAKNDTFARFDVSTHWGEAVRMVGLCTAVSSRVSNLMDILGHAGMRLGSIFPQLFRM
jgi:hypothetical protein